MVISRDLPDDLHQRLVPCFMVQMVGNILISHRHIKNIYLPSQFEACQAATFIHNMYDSYTRSMTVAVERVAAVMDATMRFPWEASANIGLIRARPARKALCGRLPKQPKATGRRRFKATSERGRRVMPAGRRPTMPVHVRSC